MVIPYWSNEPRISARTPISIKSVKSAERTALMSACFARSGTTTRLKISVPYMVAKKPRVNSRPLLAKILTNLGTSSRCICNRKLSMPLTFAPSAVAPSILTKRSNGPVMAKMSLWSLDPTPNFPPNQRVNPPT